MHQLGVGREGDRLLLHGRVDDHLPKVRGLGGSGPSCDGQALLDQRDEPLLPHALAPARQRRAVEGKLMAEELLAAEQLVIRVLDPALAQHLVREVVHVLEDRQPRHQPRRQRRAAGRIRIDGSELLLEEAPVDRRCELHHWMIKIDDLVEPRPEEIALPVCRRSFGRMKTPVLALKQPGITARTPDQFARKSVHNGRNPANTITSHSPKATADQGLGSSGRRREGVKDMPLIPDAAAFQKSLAMLPIATYEPGEMVIAAGATTGKLLLLRQGVVEVVREGTQIARISEPGSVFGELAVLLDKPHTADTLDQMFA